MNAQIKVIDAQPPKPKLKWKDIAAQFSKLRPGKALSIDRSLLGGNPSAHIRTCLGRFIDNDTFSIQTGDSEMRVFRTEGEK